MDRKVVDKAAAEVFGKATPVTRFVFKPTRSALLGLAALAAATLLGVVAFTRHGDGERSGVVAMAASSAQASASAAGVAAAGPVPQASSASSPAVAPFTTSEAPFTSLIRTEREAWRELAPVWNLAVGDGDPCQAAQRSEVLCFKSSSSLALIRQLGRPGILTLRPLDEKSDDKPGFALLTGLTPQTATLRMQGVSQTVSLDSLAKTWRGEFATYWKAPAGYRDKVVDGNTGPAVDWLAARLAKLQNQPAPTEKQTFNAALKAKVYAFQFAQELKPDGIAGPETFMLLNRATGVDEPRLQTEE